MLPINTTRHDYEVASGIHFSQLVSYLIQDYEEVVLPPAKTVPPREFERLIPVSELDELARGSFPVSDFTVQFKASSDPNSPGIHISE